MAPPKQMAALISRRRSANDTITGGSGNDTLAGGNGNDNITAGLGDDVLWGCR
ncbi:MAG: hypothetical protein IPP22_14835 [Nitrosomonas sp.]|nr:hypothetical protein [Nitrosomonas sp.]